MNKENTEYLLKKFPQLYQRHMLPMSETCMCWGFDCGDGWFGIIEKLSEQLEPLGVIAEQVKEKYGGLRFYYDGPPEADEYVMAAEEQSLETCEVCGEPGTINEGGWLQVRCSECGGKRRDGSGI